MFQINIQAVGRCFCSLLLTGFLLLASSPALATTAGTVSALPKERALIISAPYSGDDGAPNTLRIEWDLQGGTWGGADYGTVTLPHADSSYTYEIANLTNFTAYQVRVTYLDDSVAGVNPQILTDLKPCNPLVHNSVTTGSGKWPNGWGIPSGQYGEFNCGTCHEKNTGNIKQVRRFFNPGLPVGAAPVALTDARTNPVGVGFGDDSNREFNRICESCHSKNKYHNLNLANNLSNNHNNGSDCISCHQHRRGFRASCSACHGGGRTDTATPNFWPDDSNANAANVAGRHARHMEVLASRVYTQTLTDLLNAPTSPDQQKALCEYCHPSPAGITLHNNTTGNVTGMKRLWNATDDDGSWSLAGDGGKGTCTTVDCHNNLTTPTDLSWYGSSGATCLLCHTENLSNAAAIADPASGLHIDQAVVDVTAHDGSFGVGGTCRSCHADPPTASHLNGTWETDTATYTFDAGITLNKGTTTDATDDTCASICHSDGGHWYRKWSTDAFDVTALVADQPLPVRCDVCHGVFGKWTAGVSHAGTFGGLASTAGSSHNSQAPSPGAVCEDCHVYPARADLHENGVITLNDSAVGVVDPTQTTVSSVDYIYCKACHNTDILPPDADSNTFPESMAFAYAEIDGVHKPEGGCFSGKAGCHGDATQNWWPNAEGSDPAQSTSGGINYGYPNRAGAHPEHNITIGRLIAETRTGIPGTTPTQDDYNHTCQFCHPMTKNAAGILSATNHNDGKTDLYGGYVFPGASKVGIVALGNPALDSWAGYDSDPNDGYIYQLDNPDLPGSLYPLDKNGSYRQFLYGYRADAAVNHGTCSNIACHSNGPFTPQWYGDEQPPGAVGSLQGYTHDPDPSHQAGVTDRPGTVLLTWTAPGDNGDLDGTAYEYEVYYSAAGQITSANLASASRAGGAPTVLRKGQAQRMVVDGLNPGISYWFAVRVKDQPTYEDLNGDGIHDTVIDNGRYSSLIATAAATAAHADDVAPAFWGLNFALSHDSGGAVNLSWDAARDHTLPIGYRVYWSEYSLKTHLARGGTLPVPGATALAGGVESIGYSENAGGGEPTSPGSDYTIYVTTTSALRKQITGLGSGVLYNFLVRAQDGVAAPNVDSNRIVTMALPTSLPQEPEITRLYLMNGTSVLTPQADPTTPDWGVTDGTNTLTDTGSVTFTAATALNATRPTWVQGVSFAMQVENLDRKLPQSFKIQLGYDDGAFRTLGPAIDVGLGRRASRVMNVGISSAFGQVPANARMAVQLTRTTTSGSTSGIAFSWGSSTTKGQILFNSQPINRAPSQPVIQALSRAAGGYVQVKWAPSTDGGDDGQTLHYDLYGSCDGGASWPYVVGLGLKDVDAAAGVRWDTVGDGITGASFNCQVRAHASDGFLYEATPGSHVWSSHVVSASASLTLDNRFDDEAPAAPTIHHIETRPKQGTVYLQWIAVGNDGLNHGSRAAYYDFRYRKTADGALNDATWNDAATILAKGEPVPGFSGTGEAFELLNMTPDTSYSVAMKACDKGEDNVVLTADDNCSPISLVVSRTSGQYYCGICHSTPPDEPDTRGTHREHGYTLDDCAKCHGDGTNPGGNDVRLYDGRHYDGVINIGWGRDAAGNQLTLAGLGLQSGGSGVSVSQGGTQIYNDPDGAGGYNAGTVYNPSLPLANTDSGSCMNFIGTNASGCHGPFTPKWENDTAAAKKVPHCADCHGANGLADPATRNVDPYGRVWDDNSGGVPSDQVKAAPPVANHGGTATTDRYVGAHERHLNASFRFAKGDSCRLCHKETADAGLHTDRQVDIRFDVSADKSETEKATVSYDLVGDGKGITCSNLNNTYCHDSGARWAEPGAKCNSCHGMDGKEYTVGSATSGIGHVFDGGVVRDCTYCHLAGHPQSPDGIASGAAEALLINNNPAVGIGYRSGGIHLRKAIGGRTAMNDGSPIDTLAEICWGCHEDQSPVVSEWGQNNRVATGSSPYNYGTLNQTNWVGAIWSSGYGQNTGDPFYYKRGLIQSTHTANPTGTSQVVWNAARGRYDETSDTVDKIRCSYCHDVHDSNLAAGDTMSGAPYLRGTWKGNPYEEDGAPWAARTYSSTLATFQAVPRGGTAYGQLGGYYIDQNNVRPGTGNSATPTAAQYPTSGWTLQSTASLCTICHGTNVDVMDQRRSATDPVEGYLWLGANGHSNSAIGGTFSSAVNVFNYSHGRPAPVYYNWGGGRPTNNNHKPLQVPDMAYLYQGENGLAGGGYRGIDTYAGKYIPQMSSYAQPYAFNSYDWGATVDADTTDQMYHQFSCSKCHNPHASRLPKLMITNCLDIRHNTWDDSKSTAQTLYTAGALDAVDRGMRAAYYASAQNCHRFDPARGDTNNDGTYDNKALRGGWNKVTPWVTSNLDDSEHKGASDPAYGTSNTTTPWRHSDFPTEPTGW